MQKEAVVAYFEFAWREENHGTSGEESPRAPQASNPLSPKNMYEALPNKLCR